MGEEKGEGFDILDLHMVGCYLICLLQIIWSLVRIRRISNAG